MNRMIFAFFFATSILLGAAETNLIKNGKFSELRKNGTAEHWSGKLEAGSGIVPNASPDGGNALKLSKTTTGLSQDVRVQEGKVYKVTYRLKTDFPKWLTAASFSILWEDAKGMPLWTKWKDQKVWNMTIRNLQGSRDWQTVTVDSCVAPKDACFAKISLQMAFDKDGTCWFDDLVMTEVRPGDNFENRMTSIPFCKTEVPADDFFHPKYWKNSAVLSDFVVPGTRTRVKNPTSAQIFYTQDALFVNIRCDLQNADQLKLNDKFVYSMQESCELFLQVPGDDHQYQIFITADGQLFAFYEKWNDGSWPMKTPPWENHGIRKHFQKEKDHWSVGLRIPFSGMKRSTPAAGEAWRMNVCRSCVKGNDRELGAWSALKEGHFQFPGDFGKAIFGGTSVLIKDIRLDANGANLILGNSGKEDLQLEGCFVKHTISGSWRISSEKIQLPAGKESVFTLNVPEKGADLRFFELYQGEKLLAKHCNMPNEKFFEFYVFDPENVRGKVMNLAVDHPFFLRFSMKHNAEGKTVHRLINREDRAFDLYLELPKGIRFSGMLYDAGEWRQSDLIKPSTKEIVRDGVTWQVWKFELPLLCNYGAYLFCYECDLPEGKDLTGSYYLTDNGTELPRHSLFFRTMKIGSVKRPAKRFCNDMFYMDAKVIRCVFPKDTLKHYTELGFNRFSVNVQPYRNDTFYTGNAPKTTEDYYDLLFKDMKKTGTKLFFTSNSSTATPQAWDWTHRDPTARAIGADGKDAPFNQYGYPSLCPNYRGTYFQKHVDKLKNSYLFRKYHCTWLTLDLELWPPNVWPKLCFCQRCLDDFHTYAKTACPEYASADVRKLFLAKDAKFTKAWTTYKGVVHARFIHDLTEPVKQSAAGFMPSSPRKDFVISEWCKPRTHLLNTINIFELGLYYTPDVVYKHFQELYEKWGDDVKNWYPTYTFGQSEGCPDFHMKAEQLTELVYEGAIFGMQGICWFTYQGVEPLRLQYIIKGLNTVIPFEDLIVEGKIIPDFTISNPAMQLTARKNGPEGLIAVRAYQSPEPQTGKITLAKLQDPLEIYDAETGKRIATLTPQNPSFEISVNANRCRLLYFGTSGQWNKRK